MATLYRTDGTQEEKTPANDRRFSLEELQGFVDGLIEMIDLGEGWMIVNEEGKIIHLPYNPAATRIARPVLFTFDAGIFGDALVMSRAEAGDEDKDEPEPELETCPECGQVLDYQFGLGFIPHRHHEGESERTERAA